jgi:hypothetical protein
MQTQCLSVAVAGNTLLDQRTAPVCEGKTAPWSADHTWSARWRWG